jgi:glutaredoxin
MWSWLFGRRARRPRDVVMYTRQGCHLCEQAWDVLQRAARRYPLALRQVDIESDPALVEQHGEHVPVVVIDGQVRFRGVVNPVLLARILRAREP